MKITPWSASTAFDMQINVKWEDGSLDIGVYEVSLQRVLCQYLKMNAFINMHT